MLTFVCTLQCLSKEALLAVSNRKGFLPFLRPWHGEVLLWTCEIYLQGLDSHSDFFFLSLWSLCFWFFHSFLSLLFLIEWHLRHLTIRQSGEPSVTTRHLFRGTRRGFTRDQTRQNDTHRPHRYMDTTKLIIEYMLDGSLIATGTLEPWTRDFAGARTTFTM